MHISFHKMQATGNDFVVIDNRRAGLSQQAMQQITPLLCNRRYGVGADGALFLGTSDTHDFEMIYRNADGSDAGMCGNGGRAIAHFAATLGLGNDLRFNVHDKSYRAEVTGNTVSLHFADLACTPEFACTFEDHNLYRIFSGTDHVVMPLFEGESPREKVYQWGKEIRNHHAFQPRGTNVNFYLPEADHLILATYERGVEDLTLACGTGTVATVITHHFLGNFPVTASLQTTTVQCPGGKLEVDFRIDESGQYTGIVLRGEAHFVFEGSIQV